MLTGNNEWTQCTYSQEPVVDSLQTESLDIPHWLQLSGNPTLHKSSENAGMRDGFPDCECGKGTFNCLIHPNTPEKWIASMRDSLAKTLASLESNQAWVREPDQVFTAKSCALLTRYDHDSCSWKTSQQSFLTDSEPFSETWPRWGMTAGGAAYAHPMSERRITETGGFYLPTPTTGSGGGERSGARAGTGDLHFMARKGLWPTPRENSAMAAAITPESAWNTNRFPNLETMVGRMMWPTPSATDGKGSPTPSATAQRLAESARGVRLPEELTRRGDIGKLNPAWVEWLMGWPVGYTVLRHSETGKSRSKPQWLGDYLEGLE